jgi:hypothetical protein
MLNSNKHYLYCIISFVFSCGGGDSSTTTSSSLEENSPSSSIISGVAFDALIREGIIEIHRWDGEKGELIAKLV